MERELVQVESWVVEQVERPALIVELVEVLELIEIEVQELELVALPVQLKPQERRMDYYLNQSPLVAN